MMIKKEYITPAIEVVEMEMTSCMMTVSNDKPIGGDSENPPFEELSNRRRNFWDEIGEK